MFNIFEKYLSERVTLSGAEITLIRSLLVEKEIGRREFVLKEGEPADHTNFVAKGLLCLSRID